MKQLLVLASLIPCAQDDPWSRIARRHRELLDSIHSLEAEVSARISFDGGASWKPSAEVTWRKQGKKDRFTSVNFLIHDGDKWREQKIFGDRYLGPDGKKEVNGWDPANPPALPLSPQNAYGRVSCNMGSPARTTAIEGAPYWLLFLATPLQTLDELIETASTKKILPAPDEDPELLGLELFDPKTDYWYTIFVDPRKGYSILKDTIHIPQKGRPVTKATRKVLEQTEVEPGVYVASHVQMFSDDAPARLIDVRVKSIKVNHPLAESALEVTFPHGALVRDLDTGKQYIWGSDGPERSFADSKELAAWEQEQLANAPSSYSGMFWLIGSAVAGLLIVLGGWIWIRRKAASGAGA